MKKKLRLVDKESKKYHKFFIVMCDESTYEFNLNEWKVYREEEWVEVEKNDGTEMDCFSIGNIMRVRFAKSVIKSTIQEVTQLKPVPPTAA